MSLYPTKHRLALLQAVVDGAVTEYYPMLPKPSYSQWDLGPGADRRYRKVTAGVAEQRRAGWVELGKRQWNYFHAPRLWEITDEGRRVLDAAGAS